MISERLDATDQASQQFSYDFYNSLIQFGLRVKIIRLIKVVSLRSVLKYGQTKFCTIGILHRKALCSTASAFLQDLGTNPLRACCMRLAAIFVNYMYSNKVHNNLSGYIFHLL
jgi:hypothetical protein